MYFKVVWRHTWNSLSFNNFTDSDYQGFGDKFLHMIHVCCLFCMLVCVLSNTCNISHTFLFWVCSERFSSHCLLSNCYFKHFECFCSTFPKFKENFIQRETVLSSTPVSQMEQHPILGNKTLPVTHSAFLFQASNVWAVFCIQYLPKHKMTVISD